MSLVNFTNLDYDQIKISIKDYLRSNSNFTDYDFAGSNLSVIIDTLAYNTYITSYNANMVANEVFIDSATLRENVVSLAKNIGYVPQSRRAARSNISFFVDTTEFVTKPVTITLKAGIVATTASTFGNQSFTFIIPSDITASVNSDGLAYFNNIDIYEGTFITTNFTVSSNNPNQRFILENIGIDTSLISVSIRANLYSSVSVKYNQADSLFDVNSSSTIFFVQEIPDEKYEIIFGDNVFGTKPQEGNYITVSYPISNGSNANSISSFSFNGRLVDNNDVAITSGMSLITTHQSSYGGSSIEGIDSIRKYSSQIFASRNRAVTTNDYEAIIPIIYPEAESVAAFGGEDLIPPQYGKIFISIKPHNGVFLSNSIKDNIKRNLKKYSVAGIVPVITDLKYLYLEINSSVYYNNNLTSSTNKLKTSTLSNIEKYSRSTELNTFGSRFKYSKFIKLIDDSDIAITSNITKINMRRDLSVLTNTFASYEICFGNEFHIKDMSGYNIKSSGFTISGVSDVVYLSDIPNTNKKTGKLFLFKLNSETQPIVVRNSIGIIDYTKGEVILNPINIISTVVNSGVPIIEISATPQSNDVIGLQDLYLQLDMNNIDVNMISDRISSGEDISGTSYTVSSSYSNGVLVR